MALYMTVDNIQNLIKLKKLIININTTTETTEIYFI